MRRTRMIISLVLAFIFAFGISLSALAVEELAAEDAPLDVAANDSPLRGPVQPGIMITIETNRDGDICGFIYSGFPAEWIDSLQTIAADDFALTGTDSVVTSVSAEGTSLKLKLTPFLPAGEYSVKYTGSQPILLDFTDADVDETVLVVTDGMTQIAAFNFNEEPVDGAFWGAGAKAVIGGTPAYGTNPLDETQSVLMNSSNQFYMQLFKEDGSPLLTGVKEFAISYDVLAEGASGENHSWVFYVARTTAAPKPNWERYLGVKQDADNIGVRRWYNTGLNGHNPVLGPQNTPTTDSWQQVFVLFSEDKTDVYINGELKSSTPSEFSLEYIISALGGYAYIGRHRNGTITQAQGNPPTYQYFTGQIDNFQVLVPSAPATDEGKVAAAKEALTLPYGVDENKVRGNITLQEEGIWGTTITWSASHPDIVDTNRIEIENYDDRLPGVVTRPDADTVVTMTATISSGTVSDTKQFQFAVEKAPVLDEKEAYMFAHFTGEGGSGVYGEQMYFALSEDLKTFTDLRPPSNPVLEATEGDEGVRDMYLTRSPEGDRFYLIATDLSVNRRGGWGTNPQGPGLNMSSTCLAVWESDDLVNWSDMRLVDVAGNIPNAERAWAPECVYDEATGDYFVFWATYTIDMPPNSQGNAAPLMWYSRTRDFRTFTPAVSWITAPDGSKEIYDTTAILFDGNWFRASKECLAAVNRGDRTTIDMSLDSVTVGDKTYPSLTGAWDNEDNTFDLQSMFGGNVAFRNQYGAVEGPAFLRYNEKDWVDGQPTFALIVDRYSAGGGYTPFYTTDLKSKNSVADDGAWDVASSINMGPLTKRHGSILPITKAEYDAVMAAFSAQPAPGYPLDFDETVTEGMSLIADFDFNNLPASGEVDHIIDATGNARAQFMSNVSTLGTNVSRSTELPPGESAGYSWNFPDTTTADNRRWLNIQKSDGTALLLNKAGKVYDDIVVSFDLYRRNDTNNSYPFILDRDTTTKANANTGNYIGIHRASKGFFRVERLNGARLTEKDYAWSRDPGFATTSTYTPVWFHVDLVIRPDSTGIYVDGKLMGRVDTIDDTYTLEDILGQAGGVMQLGKANLNANQFFNGLIDNFQVYAKEDNAVSLSVPPNTAISGDSTSIDVKMTGLQLSGGANVIEGVLSVTDPRFTVSVSADYPGARVAFNPDNGKFSLYTTGTFADADKVDLMTIKLTLKPGETIGNGETLSAILDSIKFTYQSNTIPSVIGNGTATTTVWINSGIPGDIDGLNGVDGTDLSWALSFYGKKSGDPEWYSSGAYIADISENNVVDMADILILANLSVGLG